MCQISQSAFVYGFDVTRQVSQGNLPSGAEWQPFRGPFARWPRGSDALLAVAMAMVTIGIWMSYVNDTPGVRAENTVPGLILILILVGSGSLYWRRRQPVRVHGIVVIISLLGMVLPAMNGLITALVVSLYSLGRYSENARMSLLGLGAALILVALGEFNNPGTGAEGLITVFLAFLIWYVGKRVRVRGEYLRLLQERAAYFEREQAAEAEKAVVEERTRIARELHDIVAHQVSLMTVQAGAAKMVAADNPSAALQAMEAIEKAGRQALSELRHLVGVLRPGNASNDLGPQPGQADIPALVDDLRKAGLEVALNMGLAEPDLPAHVDLSIYRIVQESLTNILKHAGSEVQAEVSVIRVGDNIVIEVMDDGQGASLSTGSGHGIVGMRERAQLLGGSLLASSRPRGGFRVLAHLPVSRETQ